MIYPNSLPSHYILFYVYLQLKGNLNFVSSIKIMRRIKSLSLKISFSILLVVVLIFSSIFLYNYFISRELLLRNVEQNVQSIGNADALQIENMLATSAKIIENISYTLGVDEYTLDDIESLLRLIVENNDEVFGSCIAFEPRVFDKDSVYYAPYVYKDKDGLTFKMLNSRDLDYFTQDWYAKPNKLGKALWTDPYYDDGGGNILMCTYSVPFYKDDDAKTFLGIITLDISLEWLSEFVQKIEHYEEGYAFLISSKGEFITHPLAAPGSRQSVFELAEERDYDVLRKAAKDMVSGGSAFIPYETPIIPGNTWLFYTPIASAGWSMSIIIPEKAFMGDLYKLNRDLLLIGVIGFLILLVLVIYISRRITKPLTGLARAARNIGTGNFNTNMPAIKTEDEIGQLNSAIQRMQVELKSYIQNLKDTTAAKEKIESELQIARDIQQSILPKIFPPFPERESIELYAILEPARDVGGDLYDFFFVDDNNLCITVGDVSGKGVPASLFMAITRTLLRARMDKHAKVEEVISAMNNELCMENDSAMFVTLFLGLLNVETGKLVYCNAGHNYPYIRKADGKVVELKGTHGTPLGAMPDLVYGSSETNLDHKDTFLLYTDGISESIDKDEKQFSEARIQKILSESQGHDPKAIINNVLKELEEFVGDADPFDDVTILVASWFDANIGRNG